MIAQRHSLGGTFRIINLLPVAIATRIGTTPIKTKPYAADIVSVVPPGASPCRRHCCGLPERGQLGPFFSTKRWEFYRMLELLVLLL